MEKATEQLSGRVTQSQKEYFTELEGSFTDKVAQLIELHKNRVENDIFTIAPSLDAINKAIGTIVKNVEVIEVNANNYVDDYNNMVSAKISGLEVEAIELRNISAEYARLETENEKILREYEKLKTKFENLEKTVESKDLRLGELVEKNNGLLNDKLNNQSNIDKLRMDHKSQVEKLEKELHLSSVSINELDKKVSIEENKANSMKDKVEDLKSEIKDIKASNKLDVKELNSKVDSIVEQLGEERLSKQKLEFELNNKFESKVKELCDKDSIIEKLTKEIESLKKGSKGSKAIAKEGKE